MDNRRKCSYNNADGVFGRYNHYLKRHYIGHYNPAGNFFCTGSIRDAVIDWLDPKPEPYR